MRWKFQLPHIHGSNRIGFFEHAGVHHKCGLALGLSQMERVSYIDGGLLVHLICRHGPSHPNIRPNYTSLVSYLPWLDYLRLHHVQEKQPDSPHPNADIH